jgi:predicted RNA-binding Zn ribbon-like protein
MTLSTVLTRSPDAAFRTYDGQATIVLPARAEVNVLNEFGSAVWNAIDGNRTLREILDSLLIDYQIGREQAEADLLEFVAQLQAHGMVS